MERELATAGLVLAFFGVLILFRYGMPFRVETGGQTFIISGAVHERELQIEARYRVWGWFGLFAILGGTALQILAIWAS